MADQVPDALALREIKYGAKVAPAERHRVARLLFRAGRVAEALDLFLLAGDDEGTAEVKARAVAEGRPLWLLMLQRAGRAVTQAEWTAAGRAAEQAGRLREAYRCYLEGAGEKDLARIQEKLPGYGIYTPQGK